jgi:hypothetical protein
MAANTFKNFKNGGALTFRMWNSYGPDGAAGARRALRLKAQVRDAERS